ncbi:MAG TPA: MarR family winged helix-turn-helix transcriptional regulator [Kribbella sp.]|jgi:DNA-binding MarR family transcriptional regulator
MSRKQGQPSPPDFLLEAYAGELTPDEFLAMRLLFALRNAVQRVNSDLASWLGADALSPGRMQLLMILYATRGPVLQRDIVNLLGISRPSVSELIELLSRDGLVETRPDPTHGRRMHVELTPDGYEMAERQIHENARRLDTLLGLPAGEKRDLISRLEILARPTETDAAPGA